MSEPLSADGFAGVLERLREAQSLLLVTHARPDGDGLGSIAALARAATAAGKSAVMLVPDAVPARYEFVFEGQKPAGPGEFEKLADAAACIVVVDTSVTKQLDGIAEGLVARREKVVVIDHHATAGRIGDTQWIDPTAAAAGVMVAEIVDALGWSLDLPAAEALAVAITSDTGWLRFSNADGRALRAMASLLDLGVRGDRLYMKIYQNERPQRLALMTRMLGTLELTCDNRIATMVIRKGDFVATGAAPDETENLVNEAMRMGCVEAAILLVESAGEVRVSLRSREQLDVAAVAAVFGGGGHARAAGLRMAMEIDALRKKITEACCRILSGGGADAAD